MDSVNLNGQSSRIASDDKTKNMYIMISQTHTKFGILVRKFGRTQFNHAAISLDAELNQLYAFARPQHNALLLAKLVPENVGRYTLGKASNVQVVIFKIEVSPQQYEWVDTTISCIQSDDSYIYNLISVLTYPVLNGIKTYKAFSCIEFVMFLLQGVGYQFSHPLHKYKPDDLLDILADSEHFRGNLLDYKADEGAIEEYFAPFTFDMLIKSLAILKKILVRTILYKKYS